MRSLSDLLKVPQSKHGTLLANGEKVDEKTVLYLCGRVIAQEYGERGKKEISPESFEAGVVTLRVMSSLWANEIVVQSDYLSQQVNALLGEGSVREIRPRRGLSSQ